MDLALYITGSILLLLGLAGCILPLIPGPPLNYLALILLQLSSARPFTSRFLLGWGLTVLLVLIFEQLAPVWGARKFGATQWGMIGSVAGLMIGIIFFPPWGIILGPLAGAFAGEILSGKDSRSALKAGLGTFVGFIFGTIIKLVVSIIMSYYFIVAIISLM